MGHLANEMLMSISILQSQMKTIEKEKIEQSRERQEERDFDSTCQNHAFMRLQVTSKVQCPLFLILFLLLFNNNILHMDMFINIWIAPCSIFQIVLYPLHIHGFSYESLRIAQIHGSFTDPQDLATFTTDLRVVTSYYELFTVCYVLLRVITIYLRRNFTICYGLSRITTSNLHVTNVLLTCCNE